MCENNVSRQSTVQDTIEQVTTRSVLRAVRETLRVPEGDDIIAHASKLRRAAERAEALRERARSVEVAWDAETTKRRNAEARVAALQEEVEGHATALLQATAEVERLRGERESAIQYHLDAEARADTLLTERTGEPCALCHQMRDSCLSEVCPHQQTERPPHPADWAAFHEHMAEADALDRIWRIAAGEGFDVDADPHGALALITDIASDFEAPGDPPPAPEPEREAFRTACEVAEAAGHVVVHRNEWHRVLRANAIEPSRPDLPAPEPERDTEDERLSAALLLERVGEIWGEYGVAGLDADAGEGDDPDPAVYLARITALLAEPERGEGALDPKKLAEDIVQSLADSEPDDDSIEGMDRLQGTPQESMHVVHGHVIERHAEVVIANALYDLRAASPEPAEGHTINPLLGRDPQVWWDGYSAGRRDATEPAEPEPDRWVVLNGHGDPVNCDGRILMDREMAERHVHQCRGIADVRAVGVYFATPPAPVGEAALEEAARELWTLTESMAHGTLREAILRIVRRMDRATDAAPQAATGSAKGSSP